MQIRLKLILIAAFTVQILGTVGTVGILSLRSGQESIRGIIGQLRQEITLQIKRQLQSYIDEPFRVTNLNVKAYNAGQIDSRIPFNGIQNFWNQSKLFPGLSMVYCSAEIDGSMQGVGWLQPGKPLVIAMTNQSTQNFIHYFGLTADGRPTALKNKSAKSYDARKRPWYKAAIAKKSQVWSDIYLDFHTSLPTITASEPVYNAQGALLGVCGADLFLLAEFSRFLQNRKLGETGIALVIERSNKLVSTSTKDAITTGRGENTRRLLATESANSRIRAIGQLLTQVAATIQTPQVFEQLINGQKEYLSIIPYYDPRGIDWLIVISLPESDFTAQIESNTRNTILFCCVALVISILLSIQTSQWISRPLLNMATASNRMAAGDFQQNIQAHRIWELDRLAGAYSLMSKQLQESFKNLEQRVGERTSELTQANQKIAELNYQLQEDNLRMAAELDVSRRLQQAILPKDNELQALSDLAIAGVMIPATEVGGDFYDVHYYHNTVTISIGDVTGHGLESGILAIMTQVATRTLSITNVKDTGRFLSILNQVIFDNIQRMGTEKNLTFLLLHYHQNHLLIAGQHEQVIHINSHGQLTCIDTDTLGFPIGLVDNIDIYVGCEVLPMNQGDVVIAYTDGITEAENNQRELYGLERLCNVLQQCHHQSAEEIRDRILYDVKAHIGDHNVYDDITLVVLQQQ